MTPRLSILVIVYDMPRQAMNTLYSLSAAHQRDVSGSEYEVVVVENASAHDLDVGEVTSLEGNFRYIRRTETSRSPAAAINVGLSECRGEFIGLMVDGARIVTPRVVKYALDGFALSGEALVAVPGYHLGPHEHHRHRSAEYDEDVERDLLASANWRADGYALFDIACLSEANPRGVFHPFLESNCMFAPRAAYEEIGGADERFQLPGGGSLNLYMYRALGVRPGSCLIVLPGEGSFHQFHGGVTTAQVEGRQSILERQREQLEEVWGGKFHSLRREAVLLGAVPDQALGVLEWSAQQGVRRHRRITRDGLDEWPDEPTAVEEATAR